MSLASSAINCSAAALPPPVVIGAEILSVEANLVQNYSTVAQGYYFFGHPTLSGSDLEFCNVTVSHTHPGWNDTLLTNVWLPTETWNGRMLGVGGGGMVAGVSAFSFISMGGAIIEGYAGLTVNGGLPSEDAPEWALTSRGNVNKYVLEDFASRSLADGTEIAKSIIRSFYGHPPEFSYWNGCSQGGRQGYMLAQRYPDLYDGIHASAPAINWSEFIVGDFWLQQVMAERGEFPHACELDALTAAAVDACDGLDGVVDGVISNPDACDFSPRGEVGKAIFCAETNRTHVISAGAAAVADASWTASGGAAPWYMPGHEAVMAGSNGMAGTSCTANGTCSAAPSSLLTDWMSYFVAKDADFDYSNMTRDQFLRIFRSGLREYTSAIGTNNADLTDFRKAGGKMITYHGLADPIIPYKNSRHYYDAVSTSDPAVKDYFRYFEAPGVAHCYGGAGAYPDHAFYSLVDWVENGNAPDHLEATTSPSNTNGTTALRILCPYPQRAIYSGAGDPNAKASWSCSSTSEALSSGQSSSSDDDDEDEL